MADFPGLEEIVITVTGGGGGGGEGHDCRWTIYDPVLDETFTFTINPNEASSPNDARQFSFANTTSPHGKPLVWEGTPSPSTMEFSGVLYTEDDLNALTEISRKEYLLLLTDDLGQENYVVVTAFSPKRVPRPGHRGSHWKHTYSMSCTVVTIDE